jgi:polyisoprenoid-binding protein YceI
MKYTAIILIAWLNISWAVQGTFVCKNAKVSIYSKAPLEDISAVTDKGTSVFNATTGQLAFNVSIRTLAFEKALMQDHFNENYMESDKYPNASFKGKVQQLPDLSKDGTYPVNVTGVFEAHGVKHTRTIPGKITVSGGNLSMTSEFTVMCKDHKIEIPKIVFKNIAESIRVQVEANYTPYK